jgi:hypothetical protein
MLDRLCAMVECRLKEFSAFARQREITPTQGDRQMAKNWSDEYTYCRHLVGSRGDDNVGYAPKVIAQYLRLKASSACRDQEYKLSALLGSAATAISESADAPNWDRAYTIILEGV